ncbi:DgyrCDS9067 [Dimorphilus gyrociliatus]|uniref:DgyrCDS9067 n=1 Tax=Dimorphilus gyrociliatus TaxID=2664684 RepID=A0A7I8VVZ9_9ANNE|nr:DgyrCDS9067 [Dimorphilus gyrociliatus]
MKFNEDSLYALSKKKPNKEGRLGYKKPGRENYKDRICKLYANMLFYYEINSLGHVVKHEPRGVIVLERCLISIDPMADQCFVFTIAFEGGSTHSFSGKSLKTCEEWVDVLNKASFESIKSEVEQLRSEIIKKTGKDPLQDQAAKFVPKEKKDVTVQSKPKVTKWLSNKASIVKTLTEVACSAVTNNHNLPDPRTNTKRPASSSNVQKAKPPTAASAGAAVRQPPPPPPKPFEPAQSFSLQPHQSVRPPKPEQIFEVTPTAGLKIEPAKNTNHWMTFDDSPKAQPATTNQNAVGNASQNLDLLKDLGLPSEPSRPPQNTTVPKDLEWLISGKEKPKPDNKNAQDDLISW